MDSYPAGGIVVIKRQKFTSDLNDYTYKEKIPSLIERTKTPI